MSIRFLGTGTSQGIPVINCNCLVCSSRDPKDRRLRSSVWIQTKNNSILIDIGPDFRQQALVNGIQRIDAILLTHEHADHTAGMDDIRPINFSMGQTIPLYANEAAIKDLQQRFYYIFGPNNYPGLPQLKLVELRDNQQFMIGDDSLQALPVQHGRMHILGYKMNSLVYITDANHLDEELISNIRNCDCLILNALRHKSHHSHFNLEQALAMIEKIQAKKTYLIHLSHQMGLHDEVERSLPESVYLAYDGLELQFDI